MTLDFINEICSHYENATGIKCSFIDINKLSSNKKVGCCGLCKELFKIGIVKQSCLDIFKYSYYQAQRFGGKYIFFCSIGLTHWCVSINIKNVGKGVIIAGPVTMIDQDEYVEDEIFNKVKNIDTYTKNELYKLVKRIPKIEPDKVTSLSEIMSCMFNNIGQINEEPNKQFVNNIQSIKDNINKTSKLYSLSKEKELINYIKESNEKMAKKILNEILASIFVCEGMNLNILRSRVFELVVLLSRGVAELGVDIDEIFGMNCYLLDEIYSINDLEELLRWSNDILNKFMDLSFNLKYIKNKDTIFKSIAYIKSNYMCRLTLEEVAKHVALSPTYFSMIFKKQMNISFSDYLNKIRVENSKKLLSEGEIKLVDISYLVGFESQSYFTKVFKKVEGCTPKQYRQAQVALS